MVEEEEVEELVGLMSGWSAIRAAGEREVLSSEASSPPRRRRFAPGVDDDVLDDMCEVSSLLWIM